jgi:hypothetical protein
MTTLLLLFGVHQRYTNARFRQDHVANNGGLQQVEANPGDCPTHAEASNSDTVFFENLRDLSGDKWHGRDIPSEVTV